MFIKTLILINVFLMAAILLCQYTINKKVDRVTTILEEWELVSE